MKYAKIINGRAVIAGDTITVEDGIIINPTQERLIKYGYKECISTAPEPKKWYIATSCGWDETETQIIPKWNYEKQPDAPDRKSMITAKIAEKYDFNDEIAMLKKSASDPDRVQYDNYVAECKSYADAQIEEYNNA